MGVRMRLKDIQAEIHQVACDKGWWDESRNIGELLALVHSELRLAEIYSGSSKIESREWPDIGISRDYVGGLLDGEGHIGITKHIRKPNNRSQYMSRVQIAIREREVIEPLTYFGSKIKYCDKSKWNKNASGIHTWTIHARQAQHFLLCVLPSIRNPSKIAAARRVLEIEFLRKPTGRDGNIIDKTREVKQEWLYRNILKLNSKCANFPPIKNETEIDALETMWRNSESRHTENIGTHPIELADIIIRVLDLAEGFGIDMEDAIRRKMEYNKTRERKHGKKF
jgi:hypothetical protein